MKKEYITPEAEKIKFVENEEIMSASIGVPGLEGEVGAEPNPF